MDFTAVVGIVSIVLAVVAIGSSILSERRSQENFNRTQEALAEVSEKAAVVERAVTTTQDKLLETVTAIAKPRELTEEERSQQMIMPLLEKNPELLRQLVRSAQQPQARQSRQK